MTTTPVLGLTKPVVGADLDVWGALTNGDWDLVDAWAGTVNAAITALNGKVLPAGTRSLFHQTTAPTGWTKDGTINDKALRVVSDTAGAGGSLAFSAAFTNRSVAGNTGSTDIGGTIGATALSVNEMPAHSHYIASNTGTSQALSSVNYVDASVNGSLETDYILKGITGAGNMGLSGVQGGGAAHTHSFASAGAHLHSFSGAVDMSVQYIDVIIAVKN